MSTIYDRVFQDDLVVPPRLYHYTSQSGLIGILSSRTLWSTRIQYLSDSTEFRYTLGLLKDAIRVRREQFEATKSLPYTVKALDVMANGLESMHKEHVHVACFTENKDDLNLWRGYCPPGSKGFSIGFEQDQLVEAASRHACFVAPCIYDPRKQSDLVSHLIDGFFSGIMKAKEEKSSRKGMGHKFFFDCVFLACLLKHPSFREEHEWRVVTRPLSDTNDRISVRHGTILPVPYFRFELAPPGEKLDVEVVVGPTPELELSMDAVETLMMIHGCEGPVSSSIVPYREV